MKKFLMILISLLIIFCLVMGFVLMDLHNKIVNAKIEITLKENLDVPFLSEAKVSDFIVSINGDIQDDFEIDTNELGEKEVDFKFKNEDGILLKYSYKINIIDNTPPVVWLGSSYTVTEGKEFQYDRIMCGDDTDSNPTCTVEGDYDTNKAGTYPLVFKATDTSGNTATYPFNLNVVKPPTGGSSNNNTNYEESYIPFEDVVNEFKTSDTEIGLDISEWQDEPDFDKLKNAGVEFVFLRVGGTKGTNGDYFLDKSFKFNIENAKRVGIKVGVYFFSYANSKESALKDAQWVYKQIKDYDIDLPVVFDWEDWSDYNDYNLSFYELTEMGNAFLDYFKDKGYDSLLYSSKAYLEEIWMKLNHPVWLAHYTPNLERSSYKGDYVYWQMCSDGRIDGIDGYVDINVRFKNTKKDTE